MSIPASKSPGVTFAGFGHYAPDRVVPNAELENQLRLEEGWIAQRTGIMERRWAAPDEAVSDLAIHAAVSALCNADARHGIAKKDIALTLLATSTPDHLLPPTAPLISHKLDLRQSGAIDLTGACAGYLYALGLADSFVRQHGRPVLVIAANILSRRINPNERASMVLFSDAAGATILAPSKDQEAGVCGLAYAADGSAYDLIQIPAGGSRKGYAHDLAEHETKMRLENGPLVFQKAVEMMADTGKQSLADAGWSTNDIDHWVPHQANSRIIEATRKALRLDSGQTRITVNHFGNASAASIPFTLSHTNTRKPLAKGDKLLMTAAGAGLTGGAIAFRM